MLRFLRGWALLEIAGASLERCLNRFASAGIAFWALSRKDETHLQLKIYRNDCKHAEKEALQAMCAAQTLAEGGLPVALVRLRRRPVLAVGTVLALALALLSQEFVWVVRVEGNTAIPTEAILHALEEEGVGFGSWGPGVDSAQLRMRMQLRLPGLQWLAANREGGVLTVPVAERLNVEKTPKKNGPANVVAARAGIITSIGAIRGTAAVEPGDAVSTGELLISGITTWEFGSQLTRAGGEVYALTSRAVSVKTPAFSLEKRYTGQVERECSVIFGRNRRKIFGNSRISQGSCDKIIKMEVCGLPGGDRLPVAIEWVEYRYYTLTAVPLADYAAQQRLATAAERSALQQMIAGRILQTAYKLTKEGECWALSGELSCEEMIARTVPISILAEEEDIGKTDKRRTD